MIEEFTITGGLVLIFYAMIRLERKVERVIDLLHKLNGGGRK